jgi:hypothetical protein
VKIVAHRTALIMFHNNFVLDEKVPLRTKEGFTHIYTHLLVLLVNKQLPQEV